jgi:hypothetical protein
MSNGIVMNAVTALHAAFRGGGALLHVSDAVGVSSEMIHLVAEGGGGYADGDGEDLHAGDEHDGCVIVLELRKVLFLKVFSQR